MKQTIKTSRAAGQLEKMFRALNAHFYAGASVISLSFAKGIGLLFFAIESLLIIFIYKFFRTNSGFFHYNFRSFLSNQLNVYK